MVADEVNVYLWRRGFHLFFPMRGKDHWRIVGILPANRKGGQDVTFESVVPSLRGEAGAGLDFKACEWFSTYRIHHRAASRFREGRCFLLGDAAHIHSPVGAQGMNTGLQDAYNLAWKLALVVQGRADEALLNTYQEERLPVARRLLNTTDQAFRMIVSENRLAGLLRTQILARLAAFAMRRQRIQNFAFRIVSQTGIHYRRGSLSKTLETLPSDSPRAGDRFPWLRLKLRLSGSTEDLFQTLDDTRMNLIVIGQPYPAELGADLNDELLRVHVIPDHPGNDKELAHAQIPRTSFYLVRPDGYIGLCGGALDVPAIADYLARTVRLRRHADRPFAEQQP
jgi:hypothetical protein